MIRQPVQRPARGSAPVVESFSGKPKSGVNSKNSFAGTLALGLDRPAVELSATKSDVSVQKKKLSSSLTNPSLENDLTPHGIGVLDTFGTDIAEVLNEGLHSSNTFYGMIPGAKQPGDILEISHVKVNKDCSHIMVYWAAPFITNFSKLVQTERGEVESVRLHDKMSAAMTAQLQRREPQFRSLLIKKMEFRRVPRITFREWTKKVVDKMRKQRTDRML